MKFANIFCFCFILYKLQREDAHSIKPQLKVEVVREAPFKPSNLIITFCSILKITQKIIIFWISR